MSRLAGRAMPRVGSAASWSYAGISSTPAGTEVGPTGWRRQLADQAGADRGQDRHADQRDRGGGGPGPADPAGPRPDQGGEVGRRPVGALGERLGRLDPHPARVGVGGAGTAPALTRAGAVALGRPGPALPAQAALQQGGGGGLGRGPACRAGATTASAGLPTRAGRAAAPRPAPRGRSARRTRLRRSSLTAATNATKSSGTPRRNSLTQRPPAGGRGRGRGLVGIGRGALPRRRSISERNQ